MLTNTSFLALGVSRFASLEASSRKMDIGSREASHNKKLVPGSDLIKTSKTGKNLAYRAGEPIPPAKSKPLSFALGERIVLSCADLS